MGKFIQIRTAKFPRLPGEDAELVNEGMYGKALALYLQTKLIERGYDAPFVCCEDWGWWVELMGQPFALGVCIYCGPFATEPTEFVCTDGSAGTRQWSWAKFRFIETKPATDRLVADLLAIFADDAEIQVVGATDEFPELGGEANA